MEEHYYQPSGWDSEKVYYARYPEREGKMDVPLWEMKAAQSAYEAYCDYTGGKSLVTGDKLPSWDALPGQICNAWHAAALAAVHSCREGMDRSSRVAVKELLDCTG